MLYAVGGLLLLMVVLGGYAVFLFSGGDTTAQDRLRDLGGRGDNEDRARDEAVERIAERIARLNNPDDEEERTKQRMLLVQAGYTNRNAFEVYSAVRVIMSITLPLLIVPILVTGTGSWMKLLGGVVIMSAGGYYLPQIIIGSQIQTRQKKLLQPFPDAMDLLVSSVEAGLGLDAAFRRVAEELETAAPELAKEFQLVNREISTGITRIEALRHLAARSGLDEISALVNMLAQADRFGTSIARSLRVHSNLTRQKRMSKAEEEAAKVSPKLTIVMILFLLPCLIVVLLGPAVINIKRALIDVP